MIKVNKFRNISKRKRPTDLALLNFLRRDPKDRNNLNHDFNDDGHHTRRRPDGNVFFKPYKEKLHAAEQVDKSILGSANVLNGLRGI